MKTLATVSDQSDAERLMVRLKDAGIPSEIKTTPEEESGLDAIDVLVEDDRYDQACDLVDKWVAEQQAEYEAKTTRRCPACGSPHLEHVPDVESVIRCRECGRLV
jgi:ribosomal protein S14